MRFLWKGILQEMRDAKFVGLQSSYAVRSSRAASPAL